MISSPQNQPNAHEQPPRTRSKSLDTASLRTKKPSPHSTSHPSNRNKNKTNAHLANFDASSVPVVAVEHGYSSERREIFSVYPDPPRDITRKRNGNWFSSLGRTRPPFRTIPLCKTKSAILNDNPARAPSLEQQQCLCGRNLIPSVYTPTGMPEQESVATNMLLSRQIATSISSRQLCRCPIVQDESLLISSQKNTIQHQTSSKISRTNRTANIMRRFKRHRSCSPGTALSILEDISAIHWSCLPEQVLHVLPVNRIWKLALQLTIVWNG